MALRHCCGRRCASAEYNSVTSASPATNSRSAYVDHDDWFAAGRLPAAVEPGFHCARTHWIQGFMTFQLARRTRTVLLVVLV